MSKIKNNVSITEMSRRGFIQSAAVLSGAAAVAERYHYLSLLMLKHPRVFVLMRRLKPSNTVHA